VAPGGDRRREKHYIPTQSSWKDFQPFFFQQIKITGRLTRCATADNKRVSAAAAHFGAAFGFRPRELRPVARSAMRAQPNSAALKNASVFGAPELRQRAGVVRKPPEGPLGWL